MSLAEMSGHLNNVNWQWSKTIGVTGGRDGDFSIYLDMEFVDGSHEYSQTAQFGTGTHDWQRAQKLIAVSKPPKFATVYILMRVSSQAVCYCIACDLWADFDSLRVAYRATTTAPPTLQTSR